MKLDLLSTIQGSMLQGLFPAGWDLARMDELAGRDPASVTRREPFWNEAFLPVGCRDVAELEVQMGLEIASEIIESREQHRQLALILPVGPMGMYRWAILVLKRWNISCDHVWGFNMDEWSDAEGNTLPADAPGAFQQAMEEAFYGPLGSLTVPPRQRFFATRDLLPRYSGEIETIRKAGGRLLVVYGIGRVLHIAFWEPHFAAEYPDEASWKAATHRLGARLHPLTVEQNAITSFKSRTTLVPAFANTIGPGLFLAADSAIGGADGVLGRGMQWQGFSLWSALHYGPDRWVPASYMPTLPGRLFFVEELAGPLVPECN
ncbi:MAG: glucosamine-6-phosphate isomerase [Planctomycetes bacterium]|nr:glucosamine-6-phosphate isomerase [Planctomycetota bacterium]